ncbi:MAG TPA: hypothetical protein VKB09_15150 [Thermomicrobiales bacterium]|nr:hypothetical protein [Thermomicrobiales bacterium]
MNRERVISSRGLLVTARLAAVLALLSAVAALAGSPGTLAANAPYHVTIRLRPIGDFGVSGKATLRVRDGVTSVNIRLSGFDGAYPAYIHEGSCKEFEAKPSVPLADAEPGRTTRTIVDLSLDEVLADHYVINVHLPATDLESLLDPARVVACGEIANPRPSTATGSEETIIPPVTGVGTAIADGSFGRLSLGLTALAIALAAGGFALRRSERRPSAFGAT